MVSQKNVEILHCQQCLIQQSCLFSAGARRHPFAMKKYLGALIS